MVFFIYPTPFLSKLWCLLALGPLFLCLDIVGVASSRQLSLSKMRCDIAQSNWHSVFADIAHILLVWSFLLNRDPNLVLSYDVDVFRSIMLPR
jgi:hypothetical protein